MTEELENKVNSEEVEKRVEEKIAHIYIWLEEPAWHQVGQMRLVIDDQLVGEGVYTRKNEEQVKRYDWLRFEEMLEIDQISEDFAIKCYTQGISTYQIHLGEKCTLVGEIKDRTGGWACTHNQEERYNRSQGHIICKHFLEQFEFEVNLRGDHIVPPDPLDMIKKYMPN